MDAISAFRQNYETIAREAGLSRAEVARRGSIAYSTLKSALEGAGAPNLDTLNSIAAGLGVSIGELVTGKDNNSDWPLLISLLRLIFDPKGSNTEWLEPRIQLLQQAFQAAERLNYSAEDTDGLVALLEIGMSQLTDD